MNVQYVKRSHFAMRNKFTKNLSSSVILSVSLLILTEKKSLVQTFLIASLKKKILPHTHTFSFYSIMQIYLF